MPLISLGLLTTVFPAYSSKCREIDGVEEIGNLKGIWTITEHLGTPKLKDLSGSFEISSSNLSEY